MRLSPQALRIAVTAAVYAAAALVGDGLAYSQSPIKAFWPPAGIGLAALLLGGPRLWPGVAAGAFIGTFLTGGPLRSALVVAAAATAEAAAAAWILRRPRLDVRVDLGRVRDVLALVIVAGIAPVAAATIGAPAVGLQGGFDWTHAGPVWFTWWVGDALGILLVTPAALAWLAGRRRDLARVASWEGASAMLALALVSWFSFSTSFPLAFFLAPVLIWLALRFGQRGATAAVLVVSALATGFTLRGLGPFTGGSPSSNLLLLQVFTAVTSITTLVVAAGASEREQDQRELRVAHDDLEVRVAERTAQLTEANDWFTVELAERRRAEHALRQSEQRLSLALKGADLGLWDWEIPGGRITYDERCAAMLGFAPGELEGTAEAREAMIHPDDCRRTRAALQAHLDGGAPFYQSEHRRRSATGGWVWILDRGAVFERDEKGVAVRMAGTHLDLTDRKRAEEERRSLESKVQQAQKIESLGMLAGGIAHDFNNILTAIIGHADLALSDLPAGVPARDNLVQISRASRRLADLSGQMLAFSGRLPFAAETVNLARLVSDMSARLEGSLPAKVSLRLELDDALPGVQADPAQVRRIVTNLVINASEAMEEAGGTIRIRTGTLFADRLPDVGQWAADTPWAPLYVFLEVSDDGRGMSPETQSKIFDPFFTTKFTGRGLGMAEVLGVVRGHRGGITVRSAPGQGFFDHGLPAGKRQAGGATGPNASLMEMAISTIVVRHGRIRPRTPRFA